MDSSLKNIMLVDDNPSILKIGRNTLSTLYNVFTIPSGERLFSLMERILPDLILLDVEMPDMDGFQIIKKLKSNPATASIPIIFLTARNDPHTELEGLSLGAVDYITKPFSPPILLKRVETQLLLRRYNEHLLEMVGEKVKVVTELQNAVLSTVAEIVEYRDMVTGDHIERTKQFLGIVVMEMIHQNIYKDITNTWDLDFLLQSAALHDVGKIATPDNILLKPGKLTSDEFAIMKQHTTYGVKIIEKIEENTSERNFLSHAKVFAGTHHERWDGTGYPNGISGTDIPLQGRLMAIVDVYDALTNERPYKKAMSHQDALEILRAESGSHFDPVLLDVFLTKAPLIEKISAKYNDTYLRQAAN